MAYDPPQQLIDQIKRLEGLVLTAAPCPAGKMTIGYGHNLDANPVPGLSAGSTINADQAERLLIADIIDYRQRVLARLPWSGYLDQVRFCALINMAFNMGLSGLCGFHKMLDALASDNYSEAAAEALDSAWGRGQVIVNGDIKTLNGLVNRSKEIANQIATGAWQEA